MRKTWTLLAVLVAALLALTAKMATPTAQAQDASGPAVTEWSLCSKSDGQAAAVKAGYRSALNRDRVLRRIFGETKPSTIYKRPTTSLCGDFDGDGRTDRALHWQCCTVSSPAPWVVLHATTSGYRIAYKRLSDTTFSLKADSLNLRTVEPKYARTDSLCCASRYRIGELSWTGTAWKRRFEIVDSDELD